MDALVPRKGEKDESDNKTEEVGIQVDDGEENNKGDLDKKRS